MRCEGLQFVYPSRFPAFSEDSVVPVDDMDNHDAQVVDGMVLSAEMFGNWLTLSDCSSDIEAVVVHAFMEGLASFAGVLFFTFLARD